MLANYYCLLNVEDERILLCGGALIAVDESLVAIQELPTHIAVEVDKSYKHFS